MLLQLSLAACESHAYVLYRPTQTRAHMAGDMREYQKGCGFHCRNLALDEDDLLIVFDLLVECFLPSARDPATALADDPAFDPLRGQANVQGACDMGGLVNVDLAELNHELNRIPMSAIKEVYSIYELRNLLDKFGT